jgi:MEMO1 family protein
MSNFEFADRFVQHLPNSFYGLNNNESLTGAISMTRQLLNLSQEYLPSNIVSSDIKAIIVPHAGLGYSGLCAASAYAAVLGDGSNLKNIKTIVMLSTRHSGKGGLLIPELDYFNYHNKKFKIDNSLYAELSTARGVTIKNDNEFLNEHSLEIQMPFIFNLFAPANVQILPILVGDLTEKQIVKIGNILSLLDLKNTLWIINSDLIHANGEYRYNVECTKLTSELIKLESQYAIHFMKPDKTSYIELMKRYNKHQKKVSICGIYAIALWTYIAGNMELIGKITSYYSSLHMTNLDLITQSNNSIGHNINMDKMFHRFTDETSEQGCVSYLGAIYISKTSILSNPLNHYLTHYEKYSVVDFVHRIVKNVIKSTSQNKLMVGWKTPPPFISGIYLLKMACFITFKYDMVLRGCIGTTAMQNDLLSNIIKYAVEAGFNDKRPNLTKTNPLTLKEIQHKKLTIDINLLKLPQLISNGGKTPNTEIIKLWKIGTDGITIIDNNSNKSALFLPNIADEMNWNRHETLYHLSNKAGLDGNDWKKSNINIYSIPGYEFGTKMKY